MSAKLLTKILEKAGKLGFEYEKNFGNCAQCTVAAIQDALDIKNNTIYRCATGFASGGALTCSGSCGGYIGGVMMIGYIFGRRREHIIEDSEKKLITYQMCLKLHDLFVEKYGNIVCKDIHKCIFGKTYNMWDVEDRANFERDGAHTTKCTGVVAQAAQWTIELINEELKKRSLTLMDINLLLE